MLVRSLSCGGIQTSLQPGHSSARHAPAAKQQVHRRPSAMAGCKWLLPKAAVTARPGTQQLLRSSARVSPQLPCGQTHCLPVIRPTASLCTPRAGRHAVVWPASTGTAGASPSSAAAPHQPPPCGLLATRASTPQAGRSVMRRAQCGLSESSASSSASNASSASSGALAAAALRSADHLELGHERDVVAWPCRIGWRDAIGRPQHLALRGQLQQRARL